MGAPMPRADYIRTLRELVAHVDASCALCLQLRPGHVRVLDATLCFFEMANRCVGRRGWIEQRRFKCNTTALHLETPL